MYYEHQRDYDIAGDDQLAFVEDVKIETLDGTATGPIKSASMQIKGPLRASSNRYFHSDDPALVIPGKVFYLTMFELYVNMDIWGLALRRLDFGPGQGCYERIGTFDYTSDYDDLKDYEDFTSAPKTLITII